MRLLMLCSRWCHPIWIPGRHLGVRPTKIIWEKRPKRNSWTRTSSIFHCSPGFRSKVHMIGNDDLFRFMDIDFEEYLPSEVRGGEVDTGGLVKDFVRYHQALERATNGSTDPSKSPLRTTNRKLAFFGRNNKRETEATEETSEHSAGTKSILAHEEL